jgi:uncharacterized membrane protein
MKSMKGVSKFVSGLCTPAKVYLFITLLSTVFYVVMMMEADHKKDSDNDVVVHNYTMMGLFFKLLFATLWLVFLNYLCKNGHTRMAWFFLLLPVVFMIFMLILGSFFLAYIMGSHGAAIKKMTEAQKQAIDSQKNQVMQSDSPQMPSMMGASSSGMEGMQLEGMKHMKGMKHTGGVEGYGGYGKSLSSSSYTLM